MGSAPKAGGEEEVGRGKEQGQERRKQTKAGSRAISLFGGLVSQKTNSYGDVCTEVSATRQKLR